MARRRRCIVRVCFCFGLHESEGTIVFSSVGKGILSSIAAARRKNCFGKTCGMETSISISELSAESAVAVVNAYGSILGDKEDRVDNSTTEVC